MPEGLYDQERRSGSFETETFTSSATYDALNRVVTSTAPDDSVYQPTYNDAGLLESIDVFVRGDSSATSFVSNIDYDAHGRRVLIEYANGTSTTYSYDPLTFRLATLVTTNGTDDIQSLTYTFDPVGNIVEIADGAHQPLFFDNTVSPAGSLYEYDPTYRLALATGREHAGNVQADENDIVASSTVPHANDANAVKPYTEEYTYDAVSNLTELAHTMTGSSAGTWTRTYTYETHPPLDRASNRIVSNTVTPSSDATYTHDDHGNVTSMPHLSTITYDYKDQMQSADKGGGGIVYFVHGSDGQRARKVWEHTGLRDERIYVGGWEIYRRTSTAGPTLEVERETLHVMDGVKRVALVETKTVDTSVMGGLTITPRFRYQLTNHLDSALVELDETGAVFSYEEFHPYGTTAYRSGENGLDVSAKRYRYCGAERDEETGFYCMGWRYHCPWLGRWTTADPLGLQAGINLYLYCRAGPITFTDPSGEQEQTSVVGKFVDDPRQQSGPQNPLTAERPRSVDPKQQEFIRNETVKRFTDDQAKADALREGLPSTEHSGPPRLSHQQLDQRIRTGLIRGATGFDHVPSKAEIGRLGIGLIRNASDPVASLEAAGSAVGSLAGKVGDVFNAEKDPGRAFEALAEIGAAVFVAAISGGEGAEARTAAEATAGEAAAKEAPKLGSFSITDWNGYPSDVPKPTGPFRLLEGAEKDAARVEANRANKQLRARDPSQYAGKQIHEIHPVKYDGSPTDPANKLALDPVTHAQITAFFNRLMRDISKL